jgi:hypothetical protein
MQDSRANDFVGLYRLTERGFEESKVTIPKDVSHIAFLGMCIAGLGNEGWELVGAGNIGEAYHCLYFKRLKVKHDEAKDLE